MRGEEKQGKRDRQGYLSILSLSLPPVHLQHISSLMIMPSLDKTRPWQSHREPLQTLAVVEFYFLSYSTLHNSSGAKPRELHV